AGETVIYTITSAEAIEASSFNFLSAPGGNAAGPFLAASKWQSTGPLGEDSAWVGANVVPVPAAVWLFGSGLIGLIGFARRKKA
ncbi:MAG: VPLPA-CTERM sorting domain-containing protein, partial [Gammaproteobacteria bacterium]|nr:VPLPA-CTERM sorting domain-containing protein [Gammaproteobacteria bacterium]